MTDFVSRLVDRTVRPVPTEPTVEPRGRSRFESLGAGTPFADAGGIEEQNVEVLARPASSGPTRARPSPRRPSPASVAPPPPTAAAGIAEAAEQPPLVASVGGKATPSAETQTAAPPAAPPLEPVLPPADVPRLEPEVDVVPSRPFDVDAPQSDNPDRSARVVLQVAEAELEPTLEPVVEVHRIPGPTIVIERPTSTDVAAPQRRRRRQPAGAAMRTTHERPVAFEGGEPLERRGLDRLGAREVITTPAIQEAIDREDVAAPVHVHIGRLEVQRLAAQPPSQAARRPPAPVLGLDDYLADRATHRGAP